ncbi:MAG: flagellar motor protein MotB, partial [Alphaproteobacteria bacterium]
MSNEAIIVKKVVKKKGGGHHGGAWKVAYADFVTAMMAFFLLLWLLNATTEEQLQGISNYFAPDSFSRSNSGAGGFFGGTVLDSDGNLRSAGDAVGTVVPLPPSPAIDPGRTNDAGEEDRPLDPLSESSAAAEAAAQAFQNEETRFIDAEFQLRQALEDIPELAQMQDSLIVERTAEGLRIQLIDQQRMAMFPSGSAAPHEHTRRLLKLVADAVRNMPNAIALTGHTDGTAYGSEDNYGNWELSSDRANAARRVLLNAGLAADRIAEV